MDKLINSLPKDLGWVNASFELNFPELEEYTQGFQHTDLKTTEMILTNELKRNSSSVNAFGLALPFKLFRQFGASAILVLQVYFLFYLRYFHRKFDEDAKVTLTTPWLYLQDSRIAMGAYYVATVLYPTIVTLYFCVKNIVLSEPITAVFHVGVSILEIVVYVSITKLVLQQVRKRSIRI